MAAKGNSDTFVFYPTFLTSIEAIKSEAVQLAMLKAVINYGLYGALPDFTEIDPIGTLDAAFVQMRYAIDEAKARRRKCKENGDKGGPPKGNTNALKKQPNSTQNNPKQPYVNVNGYDYVNISSNEDKGKSVSRFVPPTLDEIRDYCNEKGFALDADEIHDYYQSKGWLVGKVPMKDWKAAVRQWARRDGRGEFANSRYSTKNSARRGTFEISRDTTPEDYEGKF